MARPHVGRGGRLPGREPRAPPRRRRSACSTTAPRTAASARQAELAERRAAAEARKATLQVRPPLRPARAPTRSSAASAAGDAVHAPLPRSRGHHRRGTTSCTSTIAFPNKDIEDFIILRTDGTPIYNMAVVSDDIAMRITLVMRGDDHISNTPKQILLYRALGARAAAVRAPADDPRPRRQEAEQAPRRHRGRRLPAPRHPARARCSTSSRCSAGRRATTSR